MSKIAVIGANQTGLVFAEFAAKAGFDVSIYEAKKREDVAYDWTDDMQPSTFTQIGLPMPPKDTYVMKHSVMTFIPPDKKSHLCITTPDDKNDIAVCRRPFNSWLEERATAAGASVFYETPVASAVTENGWVTGIILKNGEKISADLVVDCGGAMSCVRESLPEEFHIPAKINPMQAFFVRRTFFAIPEGASMPEFSDKMYLKHMEEGGISWCRVSHDEKCADVLIGRVGELTDSVYEKALADLHIDNPIISDKVITGGELTVVPVRHPISRMVANGYALVGDSAFMTIPMIGSGMASSMVAAKMLFDVIVQPSSKQFSVENLYRYQKAFMAKIGGQHAAIDVIKTWLLNTKVGDVDFLIGSGVLSEDIMNSVTGSDSNTLSIGLLLKTTFRGRKKLPVLISVAKQLGVMNKQEAFAAAMPETYNDAALLAWQTKYESVY